MFGAGGGTSSYREMEDTDVILLWGSNARETHPIFFHHVLQGIRNGAKLYVIDPRRTGSAQWADSWLGLDVGSDIALANAVGREIIAASPWPIETSIERATTGFEASRAKVESHYLERRRTADRRAARTHPGARPRLRARRPRAAVLDARHHRAPQRGRQCPGASIQPGNS